MMMRGEEGRAMEVYFVEDKSSIAPLFDGWAQTMIWSCLQNCMGIAYVDHPTAPQAAQISIGDFCFFAGIVCEALLQNKPENLHGDAAILVPQNQAWAQAIERFYKEKAEKHTRYATKKDTGAFCAEKLLEITKSLPAQCEIAPIGRAEYDEILSLDWAQDLCVNYPCYADYQRMGLGFVIRKDGAIVCGASSYTSCCGGIEIQIDTREDERRKGLALICGAHLILEGLRQDLYPSWDAHNMASLALAQKLGYRFDKAYPVYLVEYSHAL
jgi:hypothetical protein